MIKKIIPFLLVLAVVLLPHNKIHAAKVENRTCSKELLLEEAFLRSMGPEILKAIETYYTEKGEEGRLYFLPSVINVKKDKTQDTFLVTIQVVTFERAILPPYGLETITFKIPGYKVMDYQHKNIPGEDLPKDKFSDC
jgi:hypothetical protein